MINVPLLRKLAVRISIAVVSLEWVEFDRMKCLTRFRTGVIHVSERGAAITSDGYPTRRRESQTDLRPG